VAKWRVAAFFDHPGGYTVEQMTAPILAPPAGPAETFVLFGGDDPVGTAGLGGLFVEPAFRGRVHASALVRHAGRFARAASVPVLWLYTLHAEGLHLRLGWHRAGGGAGGRARGDPDAARALTPLQSMLTLPHMRSTPARLPRAA